MPITTRTLKRDNINGLIRDYLIKIETLNFNGKYKSGIQLLHSIKRDILNCGPYPDVTLFEGANRILSDLVILYGIKYIIENNVYDYKSYSVELGVESKNKFDITASEGSKTLAGEAFNVSMSFFQGKKTSSLKKLRGKASSYNDKLLIFNEDAVSTDYTPRIDAGYKYVVVDIFSKTARLIS